MAVVSTTVVANALTTRFRDAITSQINRATVLMQALPTGDGMTGKRLEHVVTFGTDVGTARAEGADVAAYNNDSKVPATLEFGNYDDAFQVTGKALRAAAAAGNPQALVNLFRVEITESMQRLAKGIAAALYTGSGATNFIHGLTATAGPLSATGTYANIDRSTYPQWAANVASNGGVLRPLHRNLMRGLRRQIYTASGMKPDLIVCGPVIHEKYGETFNQDRRYIQEVKLRGQLITLDGGYQALEFDGIPVIEDADCPDEVMLFLNTSTMGVYQLPDTDLANPAMARMNLRGTPEEQFGARTSGITARVNPLSRSGDYVRFQLISYPQLEARRCNGLGQLTDLDMNV